MYKNRCNSHFTHRSFEISLSISFFSFYLDHDHLHILHTYIIILHAVTCDTLTIYYQCNVYFDEYNIYMYIYHLIHMYVMYVRTYVCMYICMYIRRIYMYVLNDYFK